VILEEMGDFSFEKMKEEKFENLIIKKERITFFEVKKEHSISK